MATLKSLETDIEAINRQVAELEAEKAGMPTPVSWDELQEAGAIQQVEQAEIRRGVIPRLLTAARIKRLELEIERLERKKEPLSKIQEETYEIREELKEKIRDLEFKSGQVHAEWSDATLRIQSLEDQQNQAKRTLQEMGEGQGVSG